MSRPSPTAGDVESWVHALDVLDERLRRQRAIVAGESSELPEGGLPVPSGPCPAALEGRLRALLDETQALEQRARERLAAMRSANRPSATRVAAYAPASATMPGRTITQL